MSIDEPVVQVTSDQPNATFTLTYSAGAATARPTSTATVA